MEDFDIISLQDRPALLAISTELVRTAAKSALLGLGYKVHAVDDLAQFESRYFQIPYQVVMIEECFDGSTRSDNPALRMIQDLPMNQRRHAVFFLIGGTIETLNILQAFAASVHCLVHYAQLGKLADLVQKTTAENDMFLTTYRDGQRRLSEKG